MPDLSFSPVKTDAEIAAVAELAQEIWTEHFPPIIGPAQTAYMITAVHPEPKNHAMFLSKIYIRKKFRGSGYSRTTMNFIADLCRDDGLNMIYLTVNKQNLSSIAVYEKLGFVRARELVTEIGNGFVMDDYVMEKYL